jgi:hypothetical protein
MQGLSGVGADTSKHLIFDAGVVYANIDITALEDGTSEDPVGDAIENAIKFGATRGGSTFNVGRTLRDVEVDGRLGRVKGLTRRQTVEPVLTVNMLEMTKANLAQAIAGATQTTTGKFTKITGGPITDDSYLENLALFASYTGSTKPVIVVIFNPMVHDSFDMSFTDDNELVGAVPFLAHFDPADGEPDEDKLWRIYHPGEDATT